MSATNAPWHPLGLTACRRCKRADRPHFARGLCASCYYFVSGLHELWKFPELPRGPSVFFRHGERWTAAWERQDAIREVAWRDGPWLTAANCQPCTPRPLPNLRHAA